MDYSQFDRILDRHRLSQEHAFDDVGVAIRPLPVPYNDGTVLGLYYPDEETIVLPPDAQEETALHELGHRYCHTYLGDLSESCAESYRTACQCGTKEPSPKVVMRRRKRMPVKAPADFNVWNLSITAPESANTGDQVQVKVSCNVDDLLAGFPDEWQVCVAVVCPSISTGQFSISKSSTAGSRFPFDTRISPYLSFPVGSMPSTDAVVTVAILANHDDTVPFDLSILDYGSASWDLLSEQYFIIGNTASGGGGGGGPGGGGYEVQAQGSSFDQLNSVLSGSNKQLQHGDKVRFVLTLNQAVAHFFDVAGAELIFRSVMPPGLILDDVYSIDASTVGIDAHATSPPFAAIGAWIAANWMWVALGAIGITVALGLLVAGISFLVLSIKSPEAAADTAKWVAIGLGFIAVGIVGIVIFSGKKKLAV